jgi:hypothetical protein
MTPIETGVKVPDGSVANDTSVTGGNKVASSAKARKGTRKRSTDSPPKRSTPKPAEERTFTTAELENALAEVLTFPAIPCSVAEDQWAANHFSVQGRELAKQLARHAEDNVTVYKWCARIAQGQSSGMLLLAGIMYVVPPFVHWGLIPMPNEVRGMVPGMPPPKAEAAADSTAAAHMADGNESNRSNGNQHGTRTERHTP